MTLSLAGVGAAKDAEAKQTAILESWYFLGRLDSEAPGTDLGPAITRALEAMQAANAPNPTAFGAACDVMFTGRAADVRKAAGQVGKSAK